MKTEIYSFDAVQKGPDSVTATISYDAAHAVFSGHFPDNPIVPGVCTIDMITDIVRSQLGAGYHLKSAANVKFLQLIHPDDQPTLNLMYKVTDTALQVQVTLTMEGAVLMRFNGEYLEAPDA
jgi:3-hydroxyacyl-[acyl-carrier-protein] dehydratase